MDLDDILQQNYNKHLLFIKEEKNCVLDVSEIDLSFLLTHKIYNNDLDEEDQLTYYRVNWIGAQYFKAKSIDFSKCNRMKDYFNSNYDFLKNRVDNGLLPNEIYIDDEIRENIDDEDDIDDNNEDNGEDDIV